MPTPFAQIVVGPVPFQVTTLDRAVQWLLEVATDASGPAAAVRLSNSYCVALATSDDAYRRLLVGGTGVNFPDGVPVVSVMRKLGRGGSRPERVRGPSLFRLALQRGAHYGVRHFFLGSTPETLASLVDAARRTQPSVQVVGTYSPPFADLDDAFVEDVIERVRDHGADIVWVSLGTPKQDFVAQAITDRLGITAVGVGAGFDFLAGSKPEAPGWIQRSGFEWAFRLASEPGRLWQRYLFGNVRFMLVVGAQLLRRDRVRPGSQAAARKQRVG